MSRLRNELLCDTRCASSLCQKNFTLDHFDRADSALQQPEVKLTGCTLANSVMSEIGGGFGGSSAAEET